MLQQVSYTLALESNILDKIQLRPSTMFLSINFLINKVYMILIKLFCQVIYSLGNDKI